jgi:hypothetical protein
MGKSQRDKGMRNEYLLRDQLRRFGYTADRVPASGAAQGFKGDVRFSKEGQSFLAEVKARKCSYASIYALFAAHFNYNKDDTLKLVTDDGLLVNLSSSPIGALESGGVYEYAYNLPWCDAHKKAVRRLGTLKKLAKDCDVLAIKDDNRPFLYLRFR